MLVSYIPGNMDVLTSLPKGRNNSHNSNDDVDSGGARTLLPQRFRGGGSRRRLAPFELEALHPAFSSSSSSSGGGSAPAGRAAGNEELDDFL